MTRGEQFDFLQRGLTSLGQDSNVHPCESYLDYLSLLEQWNRAYNLTAVRDVRDMLSHHILDSIAVLPYINGSLCLDAGSGAGLPGLVLALACPARTWYLLDSNGKKIRFLNRAVLELRLDNVQVIHSRIENFRPPVRFSTIIFRALGSISVFYPRLALLLQQNGRLLAMKGRRPVQELNTLREAGIEYDLHVLEIPGLDKQRHLVVMDVERSGKSGTAAG